MERVHLALALRQRHDDINKQLPTTVIDLAQEISQQFRILLRFGRRQQYIPMEDNKLDKLIPLISRSRQILTMDHILSRRTQLDTSFKIIPFLIDPKPKLENKRNNIQADTLDFLISEEQVQELVGIGVDLWDGLVVV